MPRDNPTGGVGTDSVSVVADEDRLRAHCYGLLARLLRAAPDQEMLSRLGTLQGDETEFGVALNAVATAAAGASPAAVADEYEALFIGVGSGELVPFASYYLTGFLHEKPLALLRQDMARLGIARADDVHEPEDHVAALCEMMAGLITGAFGTRRPRRAVRFLRGPFAALGRQVFQGYGSCQVRRFLSAGRDARTAVHGNRGGGIRDGATRRRDAASPLGKSSPRTGIPSN